MTLKNYSTSGQSTYSTMHIIYLFFKERGADEIMITPCNLYVECLNLFLVVLKSNDLNKGSINGNVRYFVELTLVLCLKMFFLQ